MIELMELELNNVVYFENAKVIFDSPFTVISGLNKDSVSTYTSTGAGKSLLLSSIANVLYGSAPLAPKRSKKDLLTSKESCIRLKFKNHEAVWEINQSAAGDSISKDGRDLEITRKPHQRKKIEELFPINEDAFYSYVYVQSQREAVFQLASASSRLHYITSVFQLDIYDRMKAYFTKKLAEVKAKQGEFDVINNNLMRTTAQLAECSWDTDAAAELKKATSTIKKLSPSMQESTVTITELESTLSDINRLRKLKKELKSLKCPMTAKECRVEYKKVRAFTKQEEAIDTYNRQVATLRSKIKKLPKGSLESIKKSIKKNVADRDSLEIEYSRLKSQFEEYVEHQEELKALAKKLRSKGVDSKKEYKRLLKLDESSIEERKRTAQSTLKLVSLLHDCDDGTCPTCKQDVDIKSIKKYVKKAESDIKECSLLLSTAALVKEHYDLSKAELVEVKEEALTESKTSLTASRNLIEELEAKYHLVKRRIEFKSELKDLEDPGEPLPAPAYTEDQLESMYDKVEAKDALSARILDYKHVDGVSETSIEKKLQGLKKDLKAQQRIYSKALDTQSTLKVRKSNYDLLTENFKELTKQLDAVKPIIEKHDYYKALEKAYSAKGLKVDSANEILFTITKNLNQYSSLLFAEPFVFNVFADSKGIHCTVDRGKGPKSDVRLLSGAESDAFRLLWLWVMLMMVDDNHRTNFVVLDEPDSHMDSVTRAIFVERFLPALQTIVPNIFLISPRPNDDYPDGRYLTVIKSKGSSKVEAL